MGDEIFEFDINEHIFIKQAAAIMFSFIEKYPMYPIVRRNEYYNIVKSYLDNLLFVINMEKPINTISDKSISLALEYIHKIRRGARNIR